jgi:DNA-binding transcriptional MerR regulator
VADEKDQGFRTIGEVAESLDLPPHVLRFWETRFKELEPLKRAGGRRYYRPRDVELVMALRHLLYGQGYTIKGVQRILKEQGARAVIENLRAGKFQPGFSGHGSGDDESPAPRQPARPEPPAEPQTAPTQAPPRIQMEPAPNPVEFVAVMQPEPPQEFEPEPIVSSAPPMPQQPLAVRLPAVLGPLMEHSARLEDDDIRQLRLALADLAECRRLLMLAKR